MKIAISGKGGVGKTLLAALLARTFAEAGYSVLAIDADPDTNLRQRIRSAGELAWIERCRSGHKMDLSCLRIGSAYVLHMPGELFIEYQLAAQEMKPDNSVFMAAYGDCGSWYICTEIAYSQGGYEAGAWSWVAPEVESILMAAMRKLLE